MLCVCVYLALCCFATGFVVVVAVAGFARHHRSPVRGRKDPDRGNRSVYYKEELPRAVHERRERATVEVPVSGQVNRRVFRWSNVYYV